MLKVEELIEQNRDILKNRDKDANKGSYGKLLIIAGSKGMAGAAYLSALAAFRTGIGMVKLLGPECNRIILQTRLPEAMYEPLDTIDCMVSEVAVYESLNWCDYLIIGPGLSKSAQAKELIKRLYSEKFRSILSGKKLIVMDADALNIIAELGADPGVFGHNTVITPHIGEMGRLTGKSIAEIKAGALRIAEDYCAAHGVTVVLKDSRTAVAIKNKADGSVGSEMIDSGCGALAKAGSGDVLCGFIAGISAVLKGNISAAVPIAVWMHGKAGCMAADRYGCHSILAEDVANAAGDVISTC